LRVEKRQKKTAEKLAMQQEMERLAKESEDNRRTLALLKQVFQSKFGGDISELLSGNVTAPPTIPPASIPAASLLGVLTEAGEAAASQPFKMKEPPLEVANRYPRVEDTSTVSLHRSPSPMETNPPTLTPSSPPDRTSLIVGRLLALDFENAAILPVGTGHPRLEDSNIAEQGTKGDTFVAVSQVSIRILPSCLSVFHYIPYMDRVVDRYSSS
jgi:hypothetical protein